MPPPVPLARATARAPYAFANGDQTLRDVIERLVPANPLPSRIAVAFRPGALQRVIEPIWMIHKLGAALPLRQNTPPLG